MLKQGYNSAEGAFRLAIALQRKRPVNPSLLDSAMSYNFFEYSEHYGRESLMKLRDRDALLKTACSAEPCNADMFTNSINNQIQYTMVMAYLIALLAEKTREERNVDAEYFRRYTASLRQAVYWEPVPFDCYEGARYAVQWKETFKEKYATNEEKMAFTRGMRKNLVKLNELVVKFYYHQNNNDMERMREFAEKNSLPSVLSLIKMDDNDRTHVFHMLRHATYFLRNIF